MPPHEVAFARYAGRACDQADSFRESSGVRGSVLCAPGRGARRTVASPRASASEVCSRDTMRGDVRLRSHVGPGGPDCGVCSVDARCEPHAAARPPRDRLRRRQAIRRCLVGGGTAVTRIENKVDRMAGRVSSPLRDPSPVSTGVESFRRRGQLSCVSCVCRVALHRRK